MDGEFSIASFYSFSHVIEDLRIKDEIKSFCISNKMRGSIIIAKEGINGTVAGHPDAIERFEQLLRSIGFNNLNIKHSNSLTMPFYRMKVKIKSEIIPTMAIPATSGNHSLIIAVTVASVILATSLAVVIILIKKVNCNRSKKKAETKKEKGQRGKEERKRNKERPIKA